MNCRSWGAKKGPVQFLTDGPGVLIGKHVRLSVLAAAKAPPWPRRIDEFEAPVARWIEEEAGEPSGPPGGGEAGHKGDTLKQVIVRLTAFLMGHRRAVPGDRDRRPRRQVARGFEPPFTAPLSALSQAVDGRGFRRIV